MRKDLWLEPMSHCVVGRVVGDVSCCDKETTVNVAFPPPPGKGWSDVSTARCVSVSATPMILRVTWVVWTTSPEEVSTTAKYVTDLDELLSSNATCFPSGLKIQGLRRLVVSMVEGRSLEELALVSSVRDDMKSFAVICVAHTRVLSEDLLPNMEIEGGSAPVASYVCWLTPLM